MALSALRITRVLLARLSRVAQALTRCLSRDAGGSPRPFPLHQSCWVSMSTQAATSRFEAIGN